MKLEMYVPIYGTYLLGKDIAEAEQVDTQSMYRVATGAFTTGLSTIAMGEMFGFTHGIVYLAQTGVAVATSPLTYMTGVAGAAAIAHEKGKQRLQKERGYGDMKARMAYTTPFSSGFGSVVN